MNIGVHGLEEILKEFSKEVRDHLRSIKDTGGRLAFARCEDVTNIMGIDSGRLMLALLPVAELFSVSIISDFSVGAVARASSLSDLGKYDLYLGANIEFPGQALNQSLHAEQVAIVNAWLQGAKHINAIAVSLNPCGYCSQFLKELDSGQSLEIITPSKNRKGFSSRSIGNFLPFGFDPADLLRGKDPVDPLESRHKLRLRSPSEDIVINEALSAAALSYAPYTGNLAGCAVEDNNGRIYSGRYMENAAFNPSLSPLQTAVCSMNMSHLEDKPDIKRVVLVEKKTRISQYRTTELLIQSIAPGIVLEYFKAELEI